MYCLLDCQCILSMFFFSPLHSRWRILMHLYLELSTRRFYISSPIRFAPLTSILSPLPTRSANYLPWSWTGPQWSSCCCRSREKMQSSQTGAEERHRGNEKMAAPFCCSKDETAQLVSARGRNSSHQQRKPKSTIWELYFSTVRSSITTSTIFSALSSSCSLSLFPFRTISSPRSSLWNCNGRGGQVIRK